MSDMETVLKGLECCRKTSCESCPYNATDVKNSNPICLINEMLSDVLALLKEQPEIVRCKDCKHRGDRHKCIIAFVAEKQKMLFSFYDDNGEWFCADGKRRDAE